RAAPRADWVPLPRVGGGARPEEIGWPGAGRATQTPDDFPAVIARHSGAASLVKPGDVEMSFGGEDIEKIMKEQASKDSFDWKESSAKLGLSVDAETRLRQFTCDATLKSTNPNVKGSAHYTAEVTLVAYDGARDLKLLDAKKRGIPVSKVMKGKIGSVLKEKQ